MRVKITPEKAKHLLVMNTKNRKLSRKLVQKYASDMAAGRWQSGEAFARRSTIGGEWEVDLSSSYANRYRPLFNRRMTPTMRQLYPTRALSKRLRLRADAGAIMKKHPLSTGCAYVMLTALIVFGLAGLAIKYEEVLPAAWAPLTSQAHTAIIVSLAAAFVAAAVASMRSAWHAERAYQAGPGYRHVMWLAMGYSATCIVIEVAIGKLGAAMIGAEIDTMALTALLVFFAIAPRIVAVILSGLDGLARAEDKAEDSVEHQRTLERIRVVNETTGQRIQAGVSDLERERSARKVHGGVAAIGAAAALMGAGSEPADARVEYPAESVTLSTQGPLLSTVSTPPPARMMARGPQDTAAYDRMTRILSESPNLSNRRLARAISVHHATVKEWRAHHRAQLALAFAPNAQLLDAAA